MPEIDLSVDTICEIIKRAREFHGKEAVVFPENEEELSEEDFMQILADHKNDLTYLELKDAIDDLEPDQQCTLVAIMYLGREDFSIDEWDDCLNEAKQGWTKHTADYLLSKPQLSDFLEAGLEVLGYGCEE